MWELYDNLISEIPEDLKTDSVYVGNCWTVVAASNGNMGTAMTTHLDTIKRHSFDDINLSGMKLRDLAQFVYSWNFVEASIGMAAINAFYNSDTRVAKLNALQGDNRYCTFDIPVEGKKIIKIGHIRSRHHIFDKAKSVVTLEREPLADEYPDSACEYLIPESDIILITGSAFINKTMPRLLTLAEGKTVIITGPSTPLSLKLFDFGVTRLAGMTVSDKEGMLRLSGYGISETPYKFGTRFCVTKDK